MAATVLEGIEGVKAATGRHLGYCDWLDLTQERIDRFAQAVGGEPGSAMVEPYLTVALSNMFLPQIVEVQSVSLGVNYGCDRIRFPTPVPAGARVRAGAQLTESVDIAGGIQTSITITIELAGAAQPACVIESVSRYLA